MAVLRVERFDCAVSIGSGTSGGVQDLLLIMGGVLGGLLSVCGLWQSQGEETHGNDGDNGFHLHSTFPGSHTFEATLACRVGAVKCEEENHETAHEWESPSPTNVASTFAADERAVKQRICAARSEL
jgi:hypothetical protein